MAEPFPLLDRPPVVVDSESVPMWRLLDDIEQTFPGSWVLVGGQMVLLHGLEHGVAPDRETIDADALVDVRLVPDGTARVADYLESRGLELAGIGAGGEGHRFVGEGVLVDVLAPDNLGRRAVLTTIPPARTVEVPAGSRLLRDPHRVPVDCGDRIATIPRPDLDAAIVGKAAALSLPTPERHRRDLAFLLGLVDDVVDLDEAMTTSDRRWLRLALGLLEDDVVWRATATPAEARAALRYLLRDRSGT
jgi:hypothetical protein